MVERTLIAPPSARVGPLTQQERERIIAASPLKGRYEQEIDRESAYEILTKRTAEAAAAKQAPQQASAGSEGGILDTLGTILGGGKPAKGGRRTVTVTERVITNVASSAARTIGTQLGRAILRGILGSMTKR